MEKVTVTLKCISNVFSKNYIYIIHKFLMIFFKIKNKNKNFQSILHIWINQMNKMNNLNYIFLPSFRKIYRKTKEIPKP